MIGGLTLVALPAEARVTGVKTFLVDYDATVYQKDLGSDSLHVVKNMELYTPDKTWNPHLIIGEMHSQTFQPDRTRFLKGRS
ncbi:DUF2950 family protein [Tunturiibacter gelidoferens]|jgi:Protein of unknown function (DUF2950)|uniref:Uncharacterized protein n=1 Tax=Tunturiibacter gelidiferens TaxID=3069689 RepID=A0A9X0QAA2_9BACT|nr:DUF2950 family protein [Edaphobacter lichenicola]MBB5326639.1 hypothetical protein [Edaphobacter lichenicola]